MHEPGFSASVIAVESQELRQNEEESQERLNATVLRRYS